MSTKQKTDLQRTTSLSTDKVKNQLPIHEKSLQKIMNEKCTPLQKKEDKKKGKAEFKASRKKVKSFMMLSRKTLHFIGENIKSTQLEFMRTFVH